MKILNVITGLNNGGAEAVLYRLCTYDKTYNHTVISLMDKGKYGSLLEEAGIKVYCLNMPAGRMTLSGFYELFKLMRKLKPDAVQTWMYHADLIGGVIARLAGNKNVFWNIRSSDLDGESSKKTTWFVAKLCAVLSHVIPKKTVCCARRAEKLHLELGYKKNIVIIGNGYDLSTLKPNIELANNFRNDIGVQQSEKLIGMVARYDSQKDHLNLVEALGILKGRGYNFKCCLVGRDLNEDNSVMTHAIKAGSLESDVLLLDQRTDIPSVMNGLNLHVLSSAYGEAFPNVVAESMSCGTPNVVTDVGDAGFIVGDTGKVVKPRSSQELARAISEYFDIMDADSNKWNEICLQAYKRAHDNFDIHQMIEYYHDVWGLTK